MQLIHRVRAVFALIYRRRAVESDLDDEVKEFFETVTQRYVDAGLPPEEARRQARLKFTSPEQVKEQVREAHPGAFIALFAKNVKYSFRAFRKSPAFALVTIFTLAFGIAANVTIFSIVSRFALQPPPVGDPSTLLAVHTTEKSECCNHFSWPLFADVRDQAKSFSGVAAYFELIPASIGGSGEPQRVWGQGTTANFFSVTQLPMTLGRGFAPDEENAAVVVLGNGVWHERFFSDPAIIGKTIALSGKPFTVVGVAPPAFHGVDQILDCKFWISLGQLDQLLPNSSNKVSRDYRWLVVLARLRPGIGREQVASELHVLAQRFAAAHPQTDKDGGFRFETAGSLPPRDRSAALMFFGALSVVAFLVLCIACANVANLFLVHMASREREMAVRLALGASRRHLLAQMLTESTLLSLAGGVLGLFLSLWATRSLAAFHFPAPVPLNLRVDIGWRVMLFAFVLSASAGLLFGLAPAWTLIRPALANGLKGGARLAQPGRIWTLRNVLVVAQVAMSIVLLCATGLFLRSLDYATRINIGFRSNGILIMAVDPRLHGYTPERTVQFLDRLRQRVTNLPGVTSATYTDAIPLSGGHRSDGFEVFGKPGLAVDSAELYMAGPGYWQTIGTSVIAGRDFGNESPTGPKVALVNEVFAKKLFKNASPIGQMVSGGGRTYQIIGVVNNIKARFAGENYRPVLYRSLAQDIATDPSLSGYRIVAHYNRDLGNVAAGMRQAIYGLDPSLAIFDVATMQEHLRDALFLPRLAGWLFGIFGVLGLALAAVGLYGVMNSWVSQRTREIGIRLALGARTAEVQWFIIGQGMMLAVVAVVPGLALAWAVSLMFASLLMGVPPHDPLTFMMVPLFLVGVALVACWIPARRASGAEPLTALRHE